MDSLKIEMLTQEKLEKMQITDFYGAQNLWTKNLFFSTELQRKLRKRYKTTEISPIQKTQQIQIHRIEIQGLNDRMVSVSFTEAVSETCSIKVGILQCSKLLKNTYYGVQSLVKLYTGDHCYV